jgi:putative membrane protein
MLHRVFGVAEVRLESAAATSPKRSMRVLRLDDALALERLVRHRGATQRPMRRLDGARNARTDVCSRWTCARSCATA